MKKQTIELLRKYAAKYETADFFSRDPSLFMRRLGSRESAANREATAFLSSCLSFGSIDQFLPKIQSLIDLARGNVHAWIGKAAFGRDIPDDPKRRFYRFITYANLNAFFRTYSRVIREHGTLGGLVKSRSDGTAITAVRTICAAFADSGAAYLVPKDATSACKRVCLFLRWMARSGSPVDIGLWSDFIDRRTLIMPLDTHVLDEARRLGLISGKQTSMRTAVKLTAEMAKAFPDDPLKGDFALFGHGLETARMRSSTQA